MNAVRRFLALFRDSPTFGRDRAMLISGLTIGTTGLLLNFAILIMVLPLMLNPDDRDFRAITENVEFGQLLALILLGGATAFASVLIPLRLATVFWGPRIGRYFDQVVLSGISPFRFVIGKALSQNLFLGLILFLLVPYLVLSVTLGGVNAPSFFAGLFLVWLYCMELAMVTLWASIYMNELIAAMMLLAGCTILSILGCIPMRPQPFVVTPFPALIHLLFSSIPEMQGQINPNFLPVFLSCVFGMTAVIAVSALAIFLGPLFGIIRENSTFGEVVRAGDSKRRHWFRLRLHIQRPSEIAFFYENRSRVFHRNEGLLRWGLGSLGLWLLWCTGYGLFLYVNWMIATTGGASSRWFAYEFHVANILIFAAGLALGVLLYSHPKNSTYLRIPFVRGWTVTVAKLDTTAFLWFWLFATATSVAMPFWFDKAYSVPNFGGVFPATFNSGRGFIEFHRVLLEGCAVISIAGLVVYALQRLACLGTWIKSVTFVAVLVGYLLIIVLMPAFLAAMFFEVPDLRTVRVFTDVAPRLMMVSPFGVIMSLFNDMPRHFPRNTSSAPFYIVHGVLFASTLAAIYRRSRKTREMYLDPLAEAK